MQCSSAGCGRRRQFFASVGTFVGDDSFIVMFDVKSQREILPNGSQEHFSMTYAGELKRARLLKGLKQSDVAQAAGIERTQYVGMEGGLIPSPARWRAVLGVLGIPEEAYLAGMTPEQKEKALNEHRRGRRNPLREGELGAVGFMKNPAAGANRRVFLLNMPDDSMEPAIMAEDPIYVDTLEPPRPGDLVAMRAPEGEWLVRRLVRVDDMRGELVLESLKDRALARVSEGGIIYRLA